MTTETYYLLPPDGKPQPNPADALFSSIVLHFCAAYLLNLWINQIEDDKWYKENFLAREKTGKRNFLLACREDSPT